VKEDGAIDIEKAQENEWDAITVADTLKDFLKENKLLEGEVLKLYVKNSEFEVVKKAQSVLATIQSNTELKVTYE
jgi:hypothetical protein